MKRISWIALALAILFIIGACSNATDSPKVVTDPDPDPDPDPAEEGLDLNTLTSLSDIYFSQRKNISVKLGLPGASSLQIKAGSSLPSGLSMDSDGLITGTANLVESDVASNFTVRADTGFEKQIAWTIKAPRTRRFIGNETWTAPNEPGYSTNNKITLQVLMAGGGGSGGSRALVPLNNGGGGGGGQVLEEEIQVSGGESILATIGSGGVPPTHFDNSPPGGNGGTTSFGSYLSAAGGGGGGGKDGPAATPPGGNPGGSLEQSGSGAGGSGINGKISANKYSGSIITLGGAGATYAYGSTGVLNFSGGTGGGGAIVNAQPTSGSANTGGGGAGGNYSAQYIGAGGSGVIYVNY